MLLPLTPSWLSPNSFPSNRHSCDPSSAGGSAGDAGFLKRQRWHRSCFFEFRIAVKKQSMKQHKEIACDCWASEGKSGDGGMNFRERWSAWKGTQESVGERVMKMLSGATAAPVAQYIASPKTTLHSLDPRVKQAWLLVLVVLPSRSPMIIQIGIVLCLVLVTILALPKETWKDQLGRMLFLSGIFFVMLAFGTDGVAPLVQTRTPPPKLESLPALPKALGGYSYVITKLGPLRLTRKGLSLATTASCLSFTVLQSANLCLTTTTPEQLSAALRWYLSPLLYFGAPVHEMILTLLLSLRFVTLVFDEVRNLSLSVVSRRVQWKALKPLQTLDIFATLMSRFFKNLFYHSEQIAQAMIARGFKGDARKHQLHLLTRLELEGQDILAIIVLGALIAISFFLEMYLT